VQNFSGIENLEDTFVLREGLLLRSYRAYAGWVLNTSSNAAVDFSKLYHSSSSNSITSRTAMDLNHAQFIFPTSHSVLPDINSEHDIFSVDRDFLFDHETFSSFFTMTDNIKLKLFDD